MNKQELIEEIEDLKELEKLFGNNPNYIEIDTVIRLISKLDEPQPLKLKDVIKRIEGLNIGSQKVWLDEILHELGSDYGSVKYKDGYGQGKLEGEWVGQQLKDADKIRQELNQPVVPQFVADWIKYCKNTNLTMTRALIVDEVDFYNYANQKDESRLIDFLRVGKNQEIFARAWLDGYEIAKEKQYLVKMKNLRALFCYLAYIPDEGYWSLMASGEKSIIIKHTRKELEEAGFGWVFDCEGIEIEEVE